MTSNELDRSPFVDVLALGSFLFSKGGGTGLVADFVTVVLDDGTEVAFQVAESDLVQDHGGADQVEQESLTRLTDLADAAHGVAQSFRDKVKPDELTLEIGVGLSGEVGWFFAKSKLDASITLTLTWKGHSPDETNARPA